MGDYHFVYKDVEGASTQWDDIQRKLGNLPEKPPAFKPPPFTPSSDDQPKDKSWIDSKTSEELEDLEDDLDDDRFLQEYRFYFTFLFFFKVFLSWVGFLFLQGGRDWRKFEAFHEFVDGVLCFGY